MSFHSHLPIRHLTTYNIMSHDSCHVIFFFKQEKRRHEATTLRAATRPWSFSESLWKCAKILSFTSVNSTRAEYAQDAELHVFVCWATRRTANIHTSSSFVVGCAAVCKLRYKKSCLTFRPTLESIHYSKYSSRSPHCWIRSAYLTVAHSICRLLPYNERKYEQIQSCHFMSG